MPINSKNSTGPDPKAKQRLPVLKEALRQLKEKSNGLDK
jgi:hypothetical protein